jgi:hypothetical protein
LHIFTGSHGSGKERRRVSHFWALGKHATNSFPPVLMIPLLVNKIPLEKAGCIDG